MCGIVGAIADRDVVPVLDRRPEAAGIPRLRFRRHRRARPTATCAACAAPVACRKWKAPRRPKTSHGHARHRPHPLGHARRRHRSQRASAHQPRRLALVHNGIIENHEEQRERLRELGYEFESQTDTEVIAHLIHHYLKQGDDLLQRAAARGQGTDRRLCAGRGQPQREPERMVVRAHGLPAAGRPGRGRELRRLRRVGDPAGDAPRDLPGRRRRRRSHARRRARVRRRRPAEIQRDVHVSDVSLASLELGPYTPLHAEGNPRAAARDGRHHRGGHRRRFLAGAVRRRCRSRAGAISKACRSSPAAPATTPA